MTIKELYEAAKKEGLENLPIVMDKEVPYLDSDGVDDVIEVDYETVSLDTFMDNTDSVRLIFD